MPWFGMAQRLVWVWEWTRHHSLHYNMEVEPPVISKNILFANKKEIDVG